MFGFVRKIRQSLSIAWQGACAFAVMFYAAGRHALIERSRSRTELERLAVVEKRMEIDFKRDNHLLDVVKRIEEIKDPVLRAQAMAALAEAHKKSQLNQDQFALQYRPYGAKPH